MSVAQDTELSREVALKEIQSRFADDQNSRSRFVLEAEVTGGLEHPGIVPVYGLGQYKDGRPYYAMRFIRGDSLKEAADRFHKTEWKDDSERTLELRKLLGRFVDVCNAIEYAHSRGVLHRDLKPGNIMLGKYGETLVVDWGPTNDKVEAKPLMTQAAQRVQPDVLYADAGYDAEWVHRHAQEAWGVATAIKPAKHKPGRPGGLYRSQMSKSWLQRIGYGLRWHVESFFSGMKRTMGSTLSARSERGLFAEATLKVLTYALRR